MAKKKEEKIVNYLIMRCKPLNDQYECDCDRIPHAIVNDWKQWCQYWKPSWYFEVWAIYQDGTLKCIKEW